MNKKFLFSVILIVFSGMLINNFAVPFKERGVDELSNEVDLLKQGYERASNLVSLDRLRNVKNSLTETEKSVLDTYVSEELHSSNLIYTITQMASQNRLSVKSVQFGIIGSESLDAPKNYKKMNMEIILEGRYEDIMYWISQVEDSKTLIDVNSFSTTKINNNSDILTASFRLSSYAISIE